MEVAGGGGSKGGGRGSRGGGGGVAGGAGDMSLHILLPLFCFFLCVLF